MKLLRKLKFNILYWRNPPWDTNISPPELHEFIENHPPGSALDLGCGTGTNAITLARDGWNVIGIDFIGKAITMAKHKAKKAGVNVRFIHGDVTHLNGITGSFDLILDIGCFHSINQSDRHKYIENIRKLLAPNGTYLLYAFNSDNSYTGSGVSESEILSFQEFLNLQKREEGKDRNRKSTWFTFHKSINL